MGQSTWQKDTAVVDVEGWKENEEYIKMHIEMMIQMN